MLVTTNKIDITQFLFTAPASHFLSPSVLFKDISIYKSFPHVSQYQRTTSITKTKPYITLDKARKLCLGFTVEVHRISLLRQPQSEAIIIFSITAFLMDYFFWT